MRRRLDQELLSRGLVASRTRARDLVIRGAVSINGVAETRPAAPVSSGDMIVIAEDAGADRVSRGGLKLAAALGHFEIACRGLVALDIGASTGGFTEELLRRGVARVHAIDVGQGQLAPQLLADPRVVLREKQDARTLTSDMFPEPLAIIVADVSFISLRKALPAALDLAAPGAWLVALVKPQFEVGPAGIGSGGIVHDAALRDQAVADVAAWLAARPGWRVLGNIPSPITGGSGNVEFLLGARHDG